MKSEGEEFRKTRLNLYPPGSGARNAKIWHCCRNNLTLDNGSRKTDAAAAPRTITLALSSHYFEPCISRANAHTFVDKQSLVPRSPTTCNKEQSDGDHGGSLLAVRGEWPYPTSCERSRTTQPTCSGTLGCGASCRTWMISSDNAKSHPRHQSLDSNVRFSHRRKGPGIGSLETASGRNRGPTGSDNLFTAPFRGHSVRSQLTIPHRVYHQFRDGHPGCGQALSNPQSHPRRSGLILSIQ